MEPDCRVGVECLVKECLKVGLPAERPDGPQALEGDDEVGEDGTPSCGEREPEPEVFTSALKRTLPLKKNRVTVNFRCQHVCSALFFPEVAPEQRQDGGGGNPSAGESLSL